MNNRYQVVKAVIFPQGKIVPFWLCSFAKEGYSEENFEYEEEKSSHVEEAVWDCKKKEFISFFVVEQKKDDEEKIEIGDVVCVKDYFPYGVKIMSVKDIKYDNIEDYFGKVKDEKARLQNLKIVPPEGTKVIIYRYRRPTYILEDGNEYHSVYIKKILEN